MQVDTYIAKAVSLIGDPARAAEAGRELRAHLNEVTTEIVSQGIDSDTAAEVAVARMGEPGALAHSLGLAHHHHLPWRHYAVVIPIAMFLAGFDGKFKPLLFVLGIVCLFPTIASITRLVHLIGFDIQAKWTWLQTQPLRTVGITGGLAGLSAAITFIVFQNRPLLAPVVVWFLVGAWLNRFHPSPIFLTAVCASLAYAITVIAWFVRDRHTLDWVVYCLLFGVVAMTTAWLAQTITRWRQPKRV